MTNLYRWGEHCLNTDMPQPRELTPEERLRRTFAEENFSRLEMAEIVEDLTPKLNVGQAQLFEDLYQAVCNSEYYNLQPTGDLSAVCHSKNKSQVPNVGHPKHKVFILSSPGGYGKTFLFKVISAKIRSEGGIVLNVASTGLAAQNLVGGRTAHSRFKIPIPISETLPATSKLKVFWPSLLSRRA